MRSVLACIALATACSGSVGGEAPSPAPRKDAGAPDAQVEVPGRALGMPDLASFGWRKRGGHPAFRTARIAEAKHDWSSVATTCQQALAADPGHLEAAWLLAAARGKLGAIDSVLAPLQVAAAGDFGKWGLASLELPELQRFLATPLGEAWRRRVDLDRAAYVAALSRSMIVTAGGDLYAYDVEGARWYRLTRTFGAVIGALRVTPTRVAYVSRQHNARDKASVVPTTLAIGVVDLARGKSSRPVELATQGPIAVAFSAGTNPGIWVGAGTSWRRFDDDYHLTTLPAKTTRPPGPWLEIKGKAARLHALPVAGVTADWDDNGLASAIRVGKPGRVVTVPAPGLIDGNTIAWSTDRTRVAFVARLDDTCAKGAVTAAAFTADAMTGSVTELERGEAGLAIEWITDRKLALAGVNGVSIVELDSPVVRLEGADGLVSPRHRPTCTPADPDEPPPDDPDPIPVETGGGSDAGVLEPP